MILKTHTGTNLYTSAISVSFWASNGCKIQDKYLKRGCFSLQSYIVKVSSYRITLQSQNNRMVCMQISLHWVCSKFLFFKQIILAACALFFLFIINCGISMYIWYNNNGNSERYSSDNV